MTPWTPSVAEFTAPMTAARPWDLSLERLGRGIDNAHVDVYVSPRFQAVARATVRGLVDEEVARARRLPAHSIAIAVAGLDTFAVAYREASEAALERAQADPSRVLASLSQLAMLKLVLESVTREFARAYLRIKAEAQSGQARASGRALALHDQLVALSQQGPAIEQRVLDRLFARVRLVERDQLQALRASVLGHPWPVPKAVLFNPLLRAANPEDLRSLVDDYSAARLAEVGDRSWLAQTDQCLLKVFQPFLPAWIEARDVGAGGPGPAEPAAGVRRDQGGLRGFLACELLLSGFMAEAEYRAGRVSWLDVPRNMALFLGAQGAEQSAAAGWTRPEWPAFQAALLADLYRCLDAAGIGDRVLLTVAGDYLRDRLGLTIPADLVAEFLAGGLPRRRLAQRIAAAGLALDAGRAGQALDAVAAHLRRLTPDQRGPYVNRYLVDFLVLRRDLKLAYQTYQTLDGVRLIEAAADAQLSRSNETLIELSRASEAVASARRVGAHVVIKADVRGSTVITEELRARGLNPATHFGLNFFNPVNKLLEESGAEKVFIEGDAVILALFDQTREGAAPLMARACTLARRMLQVVSLKNVENRRLDLPELELGLGIAYSPQEPNYLYDEGHRIMISQAINQADRLAACSGPLRRGRFGPPVPGARVAVVRDSLALTAGREQSPLHYNVNGVSLSEAAWERLAGELPLARLADDPDGEGIYLVGRFSAPGGAGHWLVVRRARVQVWNGSRLMGPDPDGTWYCELVVDELLAARIRRRAEALPPEEF